MKLIIDDKPIRISNFVNYLVENFAEKDKTYHFQLIAEDIHDRRFIIEKDFALNDKVLVMHNDGFDIFEKNITENYDAFKIAIEGLMDSKKFSELYTIENFKGNFVHFNIQVLDIEAEQGFLFHFIDVINTSVK